MIISTGEPKNSLYHDMWSSQNTRPDARQTDIIIKKTPPVAKWGYKQLKRHYIGPNRAQLSWSKLSLNIAELKSVFQDQKMLPDGVRGGADCLTLIKIQQ